MFDLKLFHPLLLATCLVSFRLITLQTDNRILIHGKIVVEMIYEIIGNHNRAVCCTQFRNCIEHV